jgi:hypothetical protein
MALGPVQILVVDVGDAEPTGAVLAELERLGQQDIVRLVDLMLVRHHENGQMEAFHVSSAPEGGARVAALTGLHGSEIGGAPAAVEDGDEQDMWYVADAIPPGRNVAIALLEHRWAIGLRDAIQDRGGQLMAEAWVHPLDLVAVGLAEPEA